jgi:DME family drug/metabolite transporter
VLLGLLFVSLAAIFWGTQGAAVTEFTDRSGGDAIQAAFVASSIGACLLLGGSLAARRSWPRLRVALEAAFAIGGLVAAFIGSYFAAISLIGIALAAVVAICSAPLFTTVLAVVFLRERLTPAPVVGLGAGVVGTALIFVGGGDVAVTSGSRAVGGLLLALVAGFAFASRIVLVRGFVSRVHPIQLAALIGFGAAVFLAGMVAARREGFGSVTAGWPWVVYLGAVPTTLAPLLHVAGLVRIPSIPAAIAGLLEPLTATLVAMLIFDERLATISWVGAGFVFLAVLVVCVGSQRRSQGRTPTRGVSST